MRAAPAMWWWCRCSSTPPSSTRRPTSSAIPGTSAPTPSSPHRREQTCCSRLPRARCIRRALPAALTAARRRAAAGERDARDLVQAAEEELASRGLRPDYVALVDPDTFSPLDALDGPGLLVLAARVGRVRLIDNAMLAPAHAAHRPDVASIGPQSNLDG